MVGKSCNMSSSDPEENNVLGIEVAYTHTECAGKLRTKVLNINQMQPFYSFKKCAER